MVGFGPNSWCNQAQSWFWHWKKKKNQNQNQKNQQIVTRKKVKEKSSSEGIWMLLRAVRCSLGQTCTLVNMTDFHSSLHFPLILIPDSVQHFCRKKNAFVKCWFSAISFWFFKFVLHSKAFELPSSSIFERLWEKKILTKQKQYFQNSTLLLSDYFHQPSYSFWFISIHKQTNAFLCFYCSSRIGLLLEKNNVSTTTTLLNADLH